MRVRIGADRLPDGTLAATRLSLGVTLVLRPPAAASPASLTAGRPAPKPRTYSGWQLSRLVGARLRGACPVATASRLLVQLPAQLAVSGEHAASLLQPPAAGQRQEAGGSVQEAEAVDGDEAAAAAASGDGERLGEWETPAFSLSPAPDGIVIGSGSSGGSNGDSSADPSTVFYTYDLKALEAEARRKQQQQLQAAAGGTRTEGPDGSPSLDISQTWRQFTVKGAAVAAQPELQVVRYTTGAGFMHGGIVLRIATSSSTAAATAAAAAGVAAATASPDRAEVDRTVCIFQTVPWYVRIWLHTMRLTIDGAAADLDARLHLRHISPALDRARPLVLDLCLDLPGGAREAVLALQFSKAFLHVFEWPPDAHRGFDVPAAVVTYAPGGGGADALSGSGSSSSSSTGVKWAFSGSSGGGGSSLSDPQTAAAVERSPLLFDIGAAAPVQKLYSEGLLVPLAPPDFSMPYNVVCLTSTVLAIYIGATLNALLRRPGEELRGAAKGGDAAARRKKTIKVVVVLVLFASLALYVDEELQAQVVKVLARTGLVDAPRAAAAH